MDFNKCINFEDLFKACGYANPNNTDNKCNNNPGCTDIPNGFQTLNPELFVAISGVIGEIISGRIPFNVQNAIGNWFELLGQIILTYNAQQQYFQSGPGRYYNPENYNINNQFCNTNQNTQNSSNENKINELESRIHELILEIESMKNKLSNL